MSLEREVLARVTERPASGGKLLETMQADGTLPEKGALVYAALANLAAAGKIAVAGEGPGERVYGAPGHPPVPARDRGFPPSFSLDDPRLGDIDRAAGAMTKGLPGHYFEELRRAIVADADRRAFHGADPAAAVAHALEAVGAPRAVHALLKKAERGGPVPLRLRTPARLRPWLVLGGVLATLYLLRLFVVGVYGLPEDANSMAPALIPRADGGDALLVANLLAYRFGAPERGDVCVFRLPDDPATYVKRVMGLAGETIEIRDGDVFLDGARLVKERPLLDRVKVPLFGAEEFAPTEAPAGLRQKRVAPPWYRIPAGGFNEREGRCRDVVFTAKVTTTKRPASVTVALEGGRGPPHLVVLHTDARGTASVGGETIAQGPDLELVEGRTQELWLTNADGVFRVELDGAEIARAPIERLDRSARIVVVTEGGVDVSDPRLARDLIHERPSGARGGPTKVPEGAVYVLGDYSPRSKDSRHFGPVKHKWLVGRLWAVVWPWQRARIVR